MRPSIVRHRKMKRIYLASPLGFATSTRPFMEQIERALSAIVVVDNPWNNHAFDAEFAQAEQERNRAEHAARLHAINHQIAAANEAAIRRCDFVVGVLDGVDVDSGTASEIGFAYGLGKQSWGLRTDFRLSADNAGGRVNLQVQYWIEASGGRITGSIEELVAALRAIPA